jgi:nucleoside-diphosphate-sugar epimerase
MIIGKGMVASAFIGSEVALENLIFASGVSNSQCKDPAEFEKEFLLLKKALNFKKKIIYFSTSSICDKELVDSHYINHKLNMENFIAKNFSEYLIYRLPNVIGNTKNKNTLINNFADSILKNSTVKLFKNSTRYIIDVDDVVNYVCLTSYLSNSIINLNFNIKYSITEIWNEIQDAIGVRGKSIELDFGKSYNVDNSFFINELKENNIPELNDQYYLKRILNKYL